MPFVTEELWGALPHRSTDPALLIVARWPGAGERDPGAEHDVGVLIDLVTEIRNARSSAKVPAGGWLEALVHVPVELGPTFEALRPAIERLARTRPIHRELTREALVAATRRDDLAIIVAGGDVEAAVRIGDTGSEAAEPRARASRARPGRGRRLAGGRSSPTRQRGVRVAGTGRRRRRGAGA